MKILIPMVQNNNEISDNRGVLIQPLREVGRKTIIECVVENLTHTRDATFVFVLNEKDAANHHLDNVLKQISPGAEVIISKGKTMGAACSALLAIEKLRDDDELLICGSDKYCDIDLNDAIGYFRNGGYDAGAITMDDVNPRWSYLRLEGDVVVEAAEKNPISRNACVGIYYFKEAKIFFDAAMSMIKKRASVNGQFYIAPSFNEMILDNRRVGSYRIAKENFYSLDSAQGIGLFERLIAGGTH